jgi:hypothetical protein
VCGSRSRGRTRPHAVRQPVIDGTNSTLATCPPSATSVANTGLDVEAIQIEGDHGSMFGPASALAIAFFQQYR